MSKLEAELTEATAVKKKRGEERSTFLSRIHKAALELDEDGWEVLTTPAQKWVNAATKAADDKKAIEDFPDLDQGDGESTDEDTEMATKKDKAKAETGKKDKAKAESKPDKKTAAAPAGKKDAAKAKPDKDEAAPTKKAAKPVKGNSMRRTLKQMVVKKPGMSVEDLITKLKAAGHSPTDLTVASIRSDTRDTMKVLVEAGLLDVEL